MENMNLIIGKIILLLLVGLSVISLSYGQTNPVPSDCAPSINTNPVSILWHQNYSDKGTPIVSASIDEHEPCSDALLFTGFGLTNACSERISILLNKFKIGSQCFDIPVIYESYWGIKLLSKSFQAEIKSSTDIMSDAGHTFWFALVLSFKDYIDFTVYLTPEFKSARLRKGSTLSASEILRKKRTGSIKGLTHLSIYYQVSLPDNPFTNEILPPDYYTMPFSVDYTHSPESITDEELIDIIDGARQFLSLKDGQIYKIYKIKDIVNVETAICRFPMSGKGASLTLKKNNGKWELLSRGNWVS